MGGAKLHSKATFYWHRAQKWVSKYPRHCRICLHLPLLACQLSFLVTETAVSKGLWAELGGCDPWNSHDGEMLFKLQGGWLVCFPTPEPHIWVCPRLFLELGRTESLVDGRIGPLEPRVRVCLKPGGCFYKVFLSAFLWGGKTSLIPGKL